MVYKIYNIETNMYIGTTNNNNRDASKECCFEMVFFTGCMKWQRIH